MSNWKEIKPSELDKNVFDLIGKDWTLISAKKDGKVNTMTASWGGMGVFWGAEVVYVFIRQSRYTREFVDAAEEFTLSFFDMKEHRDTLAYLGKVSGREEDKITKSGLTLDEKEEAPVFNEAVLSVVCKKMGCFELKEEGMLDPAIVERWYPDQDLHNMYIGKIEKILKKEEA